LFLQVASEEAEAVAELLTASSDSDLLGKTELALRDAVHRVGAKMLEQAANERAKKRGTKAAVRPAAAARRLAL
jgi:hypothetical protein